MKYFPFDFLCNSDCSRLKFNNKVVKPRIVAAAPKFVSQVPVKLQQVCGFSDHSLSRRRFSKNFGKRPKRLSYKLTKTEVYSEEY